MNKTDLVNELAKELKTKKEVAVDIINKLAKMI